MNLKKFRLIVAVLTLLSAKWCESTVATDSDQQTEKVCRQMLTQLLRKDIDEFMKTIAVPRFDCNGSERTGRVVNNLEKLRNEIQREMRESPQPAKNIAIAVIDNVTYGSFLQSGNKFPADEQKLVDVVLTKIDRVLFVRLRMDERNIGVLIVFVGLRNGQFKVIGTYNP